MEPHFVLCPLSSPSFFTFLSLLSRAGTFIPQSVTSFFLSVTPVPASHHPPRCPPPSVVRLVLFHSFPTDPAQGFPLCCHGLGHHWFSASPFPDFFMSVRRPDGAFLVPDYLESIFFPPGLYVDCNPCPPLPTRFLASVSRPGPPAPDWPFFPPYAHPYNSRLAGRPLLTIVFFFCSLSPVPLPIRFQPFPMAPDHAYLWFRFIAGGCRRTFPFRIDAYLVPSPPPNCERMSDPW